MKKTLIQAVRFAVVGLVSNGIGFGLYLLLTWAGVGHKVAMSILFGVGTAQTFFFNKRWSFEYADHDRSVILRYFASYCIGYLINLVALLLLVDHFGFSHMIVQGAMILTVAVLMFLLQKFWVFTAPANPVKSWESAL